MIDREAVRANAKYLRNVRPIDPEEIAEYVEDHPHPGVVRQALREEAFDLGLFEREDDTFVPAESDPVAPPGWGPQSFPDDYGVALEDLLVERYGADWHRGDAGERLREAIRRLKTDYYYGNDVEYDETAALGYAVYHLPDYYAAVGYVLDDLVERELLPRTIRVLDVGAGVGGPALGLHDYLPENALVEYHAVEPSPAADVLERLLAETRRNFRTRVHRTTAEAFDPESVLADGSRESEDETDGENGDGTDGESEDGADGENENRTEGENEDGADGENGGAGAIPDAGAAPDATADAGRTGGSGGDGFDLVLFANVLSELADPVAVLGRYLDVLAADGSVLALAPADLETATGLREVERAVAPPDGGATVYAPTLRLWPDRAPADRGWSFDVRPDLAVPGFQRRLDESAGADGDPDHEPGEFVNADVQYAYAILRRDGRRRHEVRADPDRHAKMAEMERHVTSRIDLLAVKLSRDLAAEGNPLFKIGDGSERTEHYAVLTRESALNRDLLRAPYGAVLAFENALCLWNDDEGAYNLVVDGETVVDVVAA